MQNTDYYNTAKERPINAKNLLTLVQQMNQYHKRFIKIATTEGLQYEQGLVANLPTDLGYQVMGVRFNDLMNAQDDNNGWDTFFTQYQAAYNNLAQLVTPALRNLQLLSDPQLQQSIRHEWTEINTERRRYFGMDFSRAQRQFIGKVREVRENKSNRGR